VIKKKGVINVDVPVEDGWRITQQKEKIGWCMPFCVDFKDIDEYHFYVKIDAKVGGFRKIFEMNGEITTYDDSNKLIKFTMEDPNAIIFGTIQAVSDSETKTKVVYDLGLEGKGTFAKIFIQMVRGQWDRRVAEFSDSLKGVLENINPETKLSVSRRIG